MSVPFFWLALSFALGISVHGWTEIPLFYPASTVALGLPFLWILRGSRGFLPLFIIVSACFGNMHSQISDLHSAPAIEKIGPISTSSYVHLKGRITTQPQIKKQGKREILSFELQALDAQWYEERIKQKKEVTGKAQIFLFQAGPIPEYGDTVLLRGQLERPPELMNPHGFDYKKYLEQKDIRVIFKGYGKKSVRILARSGALVTRLYQLRSLLKSQIHQLFDLDSAPLFTALILGDRKAVSDTVLDDFRKTGTLHLLAISGLNISLFAGTCYGLFLLLRLPQKAAAVSALSLTLIQAVVSGMEFSVQRAALMAMLGFLGLVLERQLKTLNILCAVFFAMILWNPKSIDHIGFQLSFLSVLSLILFFRRGPGPAFAIEGIQSTLAVTAGTFPLVVYYFNLFSWMGLLANILAIPLFHLSLLAAFAALAFQSLSWISILFVEAAEMLLQGGLQWIHLCAGPDWGFEHLSSPDLRLLGVYYLFLTMLLMGWKRPALLTNFKISKRFWMGTCSAGLCLTVLWVLWPKPVPAFRYTVFSAGKNELSYLGFGDQHWVLNTGRGNPANQGRWILEPFLRAQGVKEIQGILLSSLYKKHTGGVESLLRNFEVRAGYYSAGSKKFDASGRRIWKSIKSESVLDPEYLFRVTRTDRQQLRVEFRVRQWHFLSIPGIDSALLEDLKQRHQDPSCDVLVLPSLRDISQESMLQLLRWVDPKIILTPYDEGEWKRVFADRDVVFLDASKEGAITLEFAPDMQNRMKDSIQVSTYLGKTLQLGLD